MPFLLPFLDPSLRTPHPDTMHKTLLLGVFLAFLGSSAVAACGGDEDTTPTPANEGTSGSGGSGGSGGSSSGSSGSAGNAGQGGSAGDAGAAGSAGDAGAAGDAGSGGAAGNGGSAGNAGQGGDGGAAGNAGQGGDGGTAGNAGSGGAAAGAGGSDAGSGGSNAGGGGSAGSGGQAAPSYETDIKPILTQKCAPCHTSGSGSGGLNFNNYSDTQENTNVCAAATTKGECALSRIQNGSMPPGKGCTGDPTQDAAKPGCLTADEQAKIQAWIDGGQQP
jgi:hypothetical protein